MRGLKFLIILACLLLIFPASAYKISENKVYVNDSHAYISATPHTLDRSGYVTFEVTSKSYAGDINAVWGFNTSITKPENAFYSYQTRNGSWSDWSPLNVNSIAHDFHGKNKWYYLQNVAVEAGDKYKVKSYVNVQPNSSGKYDFAVFPSSYGTNILGAYNDGNLYYLDPWWNSSYSYRKDVTNETASNLGMGTNGTFGFCSNILWANPSQGNLSIYYNNCTDYTIANETSEVLYETEGGGLNNSIGGIWSSNAVGVWHLNGTSDSSGNNNDGTNNGATQVSGCVYDGCYDFNSANTDYIEVSDDVSLDFGTSQDFTYSAWIKSSETGSDQFFVHKGDTGGVWVSLSTTTGSNEAQWIIDDGTTLIKLTFPIGDLCDGTWHLFTGTGDRDGNAIVYLDGVQQDSADMSSIGDLDNSNSLYIGIGYSSGIINPTDGKIENVRIYDKVLTQTEIEELFNNSQNLNNLLGAEEEIPLGLNVYNIAPSDNEIIYEPALEHEYNVSWDNSDQTNCSLVLNGNENKTQTSVSQGIHTILPSDYSYQVYNWNMKCTAIYLGVTESDTSETLAVGYQREKVAQVFTNITIGEGDPQANKINNTFYNYTFTGINSTNINFNVFVNATITEEKEEAVELETKRNRVYIYPDLIRVSP